MLAGLACVPLLPKVATKAPNLEFTVQGLEPTCALPIEAIGPIGPSCPVGTLAGFVGLNAPTDWQMCDGTIIDPSEYPKLAEVLPEFKVPDLNGFIIKADLSS